MEPERVRAPAPRGARVGFVPGNGHTESRLDPARDALRGASVELRSIDYAGASSFDALLASAREQLEDVDLVYATGIGGLVVLALRAHGRVPPCPTILQGPVLWGLETRLFPKVMRLPGMPTALTLALRTPPVQRRFLTKHFETQLEPGQRQAFFAGYRDAAAFRRWFEWLTPALLRDLETRLRGPAERLASIDMWWGERDHVVGIEELRKTEDALGHRFPLRLFPEWGHYPMIDDPAGWADEVQRALAATR